MITTKKHNKYLIWILFSLSSQIFITPSFANTFSNIDISVINDDNLTNTAYNSDRKAGTAIETFIDFGKFYNLNNNWSATVSVFSQYTNYLEYDQLSTISYGITGSARKKFGLGAYSSAIQISIYASVNNVTHSVQDNNALELDISWNKRLNDVWELTAGISLDNTDAKNIAYDTSGRTLYVSTDYTFSENLLFSLGLSQRSGDIVSATNPLTNPSIDDIILAAGNNVFNGSAFGDDLSTYRLDATTLAVKISLSYALNDSSSANTSFEYRDSSLAYGMTYLNTILRVNYIYSF